MEMLNLKVILQNIQMPIPRKKQKISLVQMAKTCIEQIEKDNDKDSVHWGKLKRLYKELTAGSMQKDPCREQLLKLITPTIQKYMQYDNKGVDLSTEYLTESSK